MKNVQEPANVDCPYCGETTEILVDLSQTDQCYIEDCAVCCRPTEIFITVGIDGIESLRAEQSD